VKRVPAGVRAAGRSSDPSGSTEGDAGMGFGRNVRGEKTERAMGAATREKGGGSGKREKRGVPESLGVRKNHNSDT